ncbi:hypothetical protein GJ496_001823 [Pomphorhynchus laevis]|nr:hypothetical protein GJ496_001823 [Pomphorhynchus laevis]
MKTSNIVGQTEEIIQARQRTGYYDTEILSSERLDESTDVTESHKELKTSNGSSLSVPGRTKFAAMCASSYNKMSSLVGKDDT